MDPKKLDTQRAFNLLMKKSGMTRKRPKKTRDFENRFGSKKTLSDHLSPRWNQWAERIVYVSFVCAIILGMVAAYEIFTRKPSTKNPNKHNTANPPSVISNEQTRQIIETNLRRFLEAENIEEKARYVSMEEEEIDHLRTYYTL
ncbi:MAG: hypothetical protein KJO79_07455, partial [Verrucomicrobiae bacterium]|nr:hypothetical protein [Verrucomicrobiae bacterium]NNJ86999.1 hypothetical protein [Akkermansiaceae bacterium]